MARIGEAPILKEARYYPLAPVGAVAVTLRN
jgi:hypothetical protein